MMIGKVVYVASLMRSGRFGAKNTRVRSRNRFEARCCDLGKLRLMF